VRKKPFDGHGLFYLAILLLGSSAAAQTNTNNVARRSEAVRAACIEGRRYICGKVLQILPEGMVVDSGYAELLKPPLNRSWVVRGTVSVQRDPAAVEQKRPNAVCIGTVFLTGIPKKPAVQLYDYIAIQGYPAGEQSYSPVAGVQKTVRLFSASLERAVKLNLDAEFK
jgi:hypothetical protein